MIDISNHFSRRTVLKRLIISILLLLAVGFSLNADQPAGIEFSIRFYNKEIYFPDSRILIKAEIINNSSETYRYKVSPDRVFNIDFNVRTLSNETLDPAKEFIIARNSDQAVFYREYSLEPGERFGFVEELGDFVGISAPGEYVVQAHFFSELFNALAGDTMTSNLLSLSVLPGNAGIGVQDIIDRETGMVLTQMALPPDEVVIYMLKARQRSQWERFFLYLDVEGLYLQNPENERRYLRLSDDERRVSVERFAEALRSETTEDDFLLIPSEFDIQKTSYTRNEATVLVLEKFRYPDYTEVKQFTYYLNRKDITWTVYRYDVKNIGTE
jgi:hypothetical protein